MMPRQVTSKSCVLSLGAVGAANRVQGLKRTLLLGTMLSSVALGTALSPNPAHAVNECGSQVNNGSADIISCNLGQGNSGITYTTNDPLTLQLNNVNVSSGGVLVTGTGADESVTVTTIQTLPGGPPFITNGAAFNGEAGLEVRTQGTNASVTINHDVGTITGGDGFLGVHDGIFVSTAGSNAPIVVNTASGTIVSATTGDGIDLRATGGSSITAAIDGQVTSTFSAPIVGGVGVGLQAEASGDVSLTIGSTATVSGSGSGVVATANGDGSVVIESHGAVNQTSTTATGTAATVLIPVGIAGVATGSGDVDITTYAGGTVAAAGTTPIIPVGSIGIAGSTDSGNTTITVGDTVSAIGVGVLGVSNSGQTTLNVNADVSGASLGLSADVLGGSGNATVNIGSGVTVSALDTGVLVGNLGSGDAIINADPTSSVVVTNGPGMAVGSFGSGATVIDAGAVTSGSDGIAIPVLPFPVSGGVLGYSNEGGTTINLHGDVMTTGTFGALAVSNGGNATVTSDEGITVDPPVGMASIVLGPGIAAVNNNGTVNSTVIGLLGVNIGDGSVAIDNSDTGTVNATTGAGVLALKLGPGDNPDADGNSVVVSNEGTIDAPNGPGVAVIAFDPTFAGTPNNVAITNDRGASITADGGLFSPGIGVLADGAVAITNDRGSTIDVGLGDLALGVVAGGAVTIVNDRGADVVGAAVVGSVNDSVTFSNDRGATWSFAGSSVLGALNGDVTINNERGAEINVGPVGLLGMVAGNDATINNNRGASITFLGLNANLMVAGNDATINNDRGGTFAMLGGNANVMVAGNDATINNGRGGTFTLAGAAANVMVAGQDATINNGTGTGNDGPATMNLIGVTGNLMVAGNDATINNTNGATLNFVGLNGAAMIAANEAIINNNGADPNDASARSTINLIGINNFLMAGGNGDAVNNSGVINVAGIATFFGLDNFNNAGGTLSMLNGGITDVTATTGNFNGGAGSTLAIDAELNGPGFNADLLLVGGDTTGTTGVVVNDLLAASPGTFNPEGVIFGLVGGNTAPGHFFSANGPIDKGLFSYDVFLNPDHPNVAADAPLLAAAYGTDAWVLASTPDQTFFELPSIITAAQDLWHTSAGVWLDRTADLRSVLAGQCTADSAYKGSIKDAPTTCTANVTPGVWAKVLGQGTERERSASFTLHNRTFDYNIDTKQQTYGVMAGVDFGHQTHTPEGRGAWMFGVMAGYVGSNLDFNSTTDVDFQTGVVGGYMTYLNGGWFVDAKIVANLGTMEYSNSAGALSTRDKSDVTSIGGVIETGYRMNSGWGFVEPGAALAYVNSNIDNALLYGTPVSFGNGDSLRGRLGLRMGTSYIADNYRMEPFIGAGVWYEFEGQNSVSATSGGFQLTAIDNIEGAIGEITGGVNVISLGGDGVSGFVKGNVQFGENDLLGYGGQAGVRVNW